MRRILLSFLAMAMAVTYANAQGTDDPCPFFKNPTTFGYQGTPGSNSFRGWSARVGQRIASGASSGYTIYSTCAYSNCTDITGHSNITSSSHNTGPDAGITCCSHGTLWDAAQDHRFMIITQANAGLDQLTINGDNGMQRIPDGYTSCIRLGDPRASYDQAYSPPFSGTPQWNSSNANKSSEALFYTIKVNPNNALLFINYAVVGRCYDHTADVAGEFLIRVVKQNADGSWPNQPINDSMWFRISAPPIPPSGVPNLPWLMGRPGSHCASTTCAYVYKPWTKVAISLSQFLYENVRIEMYTSDCVPTVDPIYAYICGDYRPMKILSSGCADAGSTAIDTLIAPEGMLTYQWFAASQGYEDDILNPSHMDSVAFRPLTGIDTNHIYMPTLADFIITEGPNAGDTIPQQTFMCRMTSALDPSKPFASKIYANVDNGKPTAKIAFTPDCSGNVILSDVSFTYGEFYIDTDSTRWIIYSDTLYTNPIDTVMGDNITYSFPYDGYFGVEMRVKVRDRDCGGMTRTVVRATHTHVLPITLSESTICEGETVVASCPADSTLQLSWSFGGQTLNNTNQITWTPPAGVDTITLTATVDGLCPGISTALVRVIGNTTITSDVDVSLICQGDTVTLSAGGLEDPHWNSVPLDPDLEALQGQSVIHLTPQVTTTYTVTSLEDNGCIQDAEGITIKVFPYPIPSIWTNRTYVELTDPKLKVENRSLYGNSSQWTFSDGLTDVGQAVDHYFAAVSDSVSISLHTCNEDRCCADTTIWLPVQVNVLWQPNVFTPDDYSNNIFAFSTTIEMLSFEIWIYNRNGQLVWHGDDIAKGWDGRTNDGTPCPQGAYVYYFKYTMKAEPDREYLGDGTVTLLR